MCQYYYFISIYNIIRSLGSDMSNVLLKQRIHITDTHAYVFICIARLVIHKYSYYICRTLAIYVAPVVSVDDVDIVIRLCEKWTNEWKANRMQFQNGYLSFRKIIVSVYASVCVCVCVGWGKINELFEREILTDESN